MARVLALRDPIILRAEKLALPGDREPPSEPPALANKEYESKFVVSKSVEAVKCFPCTIRTFFPKVTKDLRKKSPNNLGNL